MTEEVKNKIEAIYQEFTERPRRILEIFEDQFGADMVELQGYGVEGFFTWLEGKTLGSFIHDFESSNSYGSYSIDRLDYARNGRGKPFLEYIPDLGILDYCKEQFREYFNNSSYKLLIHFPKARITNEHDKYIDITELWVKLHVLGNGKLKYNKFEMVRSEYTATQWFSHYSHSHLPSLGSSELPSFRTPCTGDGPVNETLYTLHNNYDENIYGLLAFEIAKYVTVESLAGVPYRKLEEIGRGSSVEDCSIITPRLTYPIFRGFHNETVNDFIHYFLSLKNCKYCFHNGSFGLGEPFVNYWIRVSNAFIEWYNNEVLKGSINIDMGTLKQRGIISERVVAESRVYSEDTTNDIRNLDSLQGSTMFTFKGNPVRFKVSNVDTISNNKTLLINKAFCDYLLTLSLSILNTHYGRKETNTPTPAGQWYI